MAFEVVGLQGFPACHFFGDLAGTHHKAITLNILIKHGGQETPTLLIRSQMLYSVKLQALTGFR